MTTIDDYNVLLNDLQLDTKQLTKGMSKLKANLLETERTLAKARADASSLIAEFVQQLRDGVNEETTPPGGQSSKENLKITSTSANHLSGDADANSTTALSVFRSFMAQLEGTAVETVSSKRIEAYISDHQKLTTQREVVDKKLNVVCQDIDRWLPTQLKKSIVPWRHTELRGKKARDINTVSWLEGKLRDAERELAEINIEVQSVAKQHRAHAGTYPEHLRSVVKGIIQLLGAHQESIERLNGLRNSVKSYDNSLPENTQEWATMLKRELKEREQHLAPNLPLNQSDLRRVTTNLFEDGLDAQREVVHRITMEQQALESLIETHVRELKLHHFDYGYSKGNGGKPSSSVRQLINKELKAGKESKKESTLRKRVEGHEKHVRDRFENLLKQAKPTLLRHFKDDPFSVLVMTENSIKPSDYLAHYKKSWHLFPNYHLCFDAISATKLKPRELDKLLNLPLTAKFCEACLDGTLTQDQAMILQDIDVHDDLFDLFIEHHVPLDLVFALHAQEGQGWLGALLDKPNLHRVISEHRHDPYDQRLWNLVAENKLKPWHYACIVRLNFSDDGALDTLLMGEDVWGELNEFAGLYDVEEELRQFIEIYKPVNDKEAATTAPLSLSDVMKTLEPIADFTVDKASTTSKKVRRKNKGRHSF